MRYVKRGALLAVAVAMLSVVAPPAMAQTNPGYEAFIGCPDDFPTVPLCLRAETNGGHIQIGKTDTPINKQIVLTGGLNAADGKLVFSSEGGLFAPPLKVPGGLLGLTGWSEFFLNLFTGGANDVYAQAILVGDAFNEITIDGNLVLTLPIRVKLINPFLISTCSIGSAGSPISLKMTTGTTSPPLPNKPISGHFNFFGEDPVLPGVFVSTDDTLVDNSFSAPVASGCDLFGFGLINSLVNLRVGLPAAAGTNTAQFTKTDIKLAASLAVYPFP